MLSSRRGQLDAVPRRARGDASMRNKQCRFLEIFRAPNPADSDAFRALRETVATGGDAPLQEFFLALNRELEAALAVENGLDVRWPEEVCVALAAADPGRAATALGNLLADMTLQFQDPLVAVLFEAATGAPALLSLLADIAESESHLLQFRVRAVEALVTKSRGDADAGGIGLEAQSTLRFLNSVLDEIEKGPAGEFVDGCDRWAEEFKGFGRLFPEGKAPAVVVWVEESLGRLVSAPTAPETRRLLLRILRANTPLPSWHPAGAMEAAPDGVGSVTALIVDKAIRVVLSVAGRQWRGNTWSATARPARPDVDLWPFNARVLEATLVDTAQLPRARAMAAALLRVLAHASPSFRLPPRAEVYSELFLAHRREARSEPSAAERLPRQALPEQLDLLLEALGDDCECIRRAASEACHRFALESPGGFRPLHYTKLLHFLSDDDPGIRLLTMRTFQVLAGFRTRRVAAVVDDLAARLHDEADSGDEGAHARHDLEIALGITMDRLMGDIEQLQHEVHALEARRRELLHNLEGQAVRVGEEIHHEVLNTLTSYLATAIDEENYREAKGRLDSLIAELRRVMNNLYPRDLETEGFLQTLRNRLHDARAQLARRAPGCTVALECAAGITDVTITEMLAERSHLVLLYRIVLEAIINARKHSGGSFIGVTIRTPASGAIEIAIQDNGAGGGGPFGENTGMALMRQRAEEIGAEIAYQAGPEGGTSVVVRLTRLDAPPDYGRGPFDTPVAKAVS
jgi:signal transduction histidine kinase